MSEYHITRGERILPLIVHIEKSGVYAKIDDLINWIDDTTSNCGSDQARAVLTELKSGLVKVNNKHKLKK